MARREPPRRWVALVRAINIGTANRIRMPALAEVVTAAGCFDVSWHIQTGNLFLTAPGDREEVASAIEQQLTRAGLRRADVMVRTPAELAELVARQPFAAIDVTEYRCEASFLRRPPADPALDRLRGTGCIITYLDEQTLCVATPRAGALAGGLTGRIETTWGITATARAWNVVEAIAAKAIALDGQP
jgi:uncharacterized protein (DUF1697 family)